MKPSWFKLADRLHRDRVKAINGVPYSFDDLIYLTVGFVGEAGEVANEVKKAMRGDFVDGGGGNAFHKRVCEEIVDVRVYLELLMHAVDKLSNKEVDWDALVLEKLESFARRYE